MWWLTIACSLENQVGNKDAPSGEDSADGGSEPEFDTSSVSEPEPCNGVDDDGDGAVDEDSPDWDGDGIADCVDEGCDVEVPEPRTETRGGCTGEWGGGDPGNAAVLWRWEANEFAYAMPVVGDVDGDGSPEVVSSDGPDTSSACDLVVLDGATGAEKLRIDEGAFCWSGISLADLDGDGAAEIFAVDGNRAVVAYTGAGNTIWSFASGNQLVYPNVADLDADGDPEVVAGIVVLDATSGSRLSTWYLGTEPYPDVTLFDVGGDGRLEVGSAGGAYEPDGTEALRCGSGQYGLSIPVQLDADAATELVTAMDQTVHACDDSGAALWSASITASVRAGAMSAGNFDGDDMSEIVVPDSARLTLLDHDGTKLWSAAHRDSSGANGAALWDIDADGVPELVYTDQEEFHIFSGLDGSVLFTQFDHQSQTPYNTPTIADIDGDGDGEILYNSDQDVTGGGNAFTGVTALYDPDHDWPSAPEYYPGQAWDSVTLDDTLSVVAAPDPWWSLPGGVFRGQPLVPGGPRPNLAVSVHDVCFSDCDGDYARVSVQVWNDGDADEPAGSRLRLYSSPGGTAVELLSVDLPEIPAATSVEYTFGMLGNELGGQVRAVVTPASVDCNDSDNEVSYDDLECE